jgi:thiamine-phosphate pyrophosphorylase
MKKFPTQGLYAITQTEHKSIQRVVDEVEKVLMGGAVVVQYRDKYPKNALLLAKELVAVCHAYQAPLIINDDVELAVKAAADGVHLGKDDGTIAHARQLLGNHAIIGVSCYNSVEDAQEAEQQGADYVAFGRFFPSSSKPLATPAELNTLQIAKHILSIPIVAIGGILPENGGQLLDAGADLLAVIGGLFTADPEQAAIAYRALFTPYE